MVVLLISGWKRSGKDELAKIAESYSFQRFSFADDLKQKASKEYGVPLEDFYSNEKKEAPILTLPVYARDAFSDMINSFMFREFRTAAGIRPIGYAKRANGAFTDSQQGQQLYHTPRSLAILKGSVNRSVDPDFWAKQVSPLIQKLPHSGIVIPDWRYKNEKTTVEALARQYGMKTITIRVNRFDTVESNDPSERELDDATFDITIQNRDTLQEFEAAVRSHLERIIGQMITPAQWS